MRKNLAFPRGHQNPKMPRRTKKTGLQVLEVALAKAEAEGTQNGVSSLNSSVPKRPPRKLKQINFVKSGTLQEEIGKAPPLLQMPSQNKQEKSTEVSSKKSEQIEARGTQIHLDYAHVNQMQLEGHLTTTSVFDTTRLYLAYLAKNRDSHYMGQTYVSVKVKLRAMGFPEDVDQVREVYLKYCCSQGVSRQEAEKDLQVLEGYIREKRIAYIQTNERQRREARERIHHGNGGMATHDPECIIQ